MSISHLHAILSATGAFGWNTLNDLTNSPNSITPLCLKSNRSKICKIAGREGKKNSASINQIKARQMAGSSNESEMIDPKHKSCNV